MSTPSITLPRKKRCVVFRLVMFGRSVSVALLYGNLFYHISSNTEIYDYVIELTHSDIQNSMGVKTLVSLDIAKIQPADKNIIIGIE